MGEEEYEEGGDILVDSLTWRCGNRFFFVAALLFASRLTINYSVLCHDAAAVGASGDLFTNDIVQDKYNLGVEKDLL